MVKTGTALFLLLSGAMLFLSCAALQSDSEDVKASSSRKAAPFRLKDGLEIWEDTIAFPYGKALFIDSVVYADGKDLRDLEERALRHARRISAQGFLVCRVHKTGQVIDYEVGRKEGDLTQEGFDLKDHGVVQEDPHYGTLVTTATVVFRMKAKFFRYR